MTHAREITDMAGRKVVVPDQIRRIYAAQPYTHVLTYMLAPDMLIGHLSIINGPEKRFLRPEVADLPMLGGAPGSGPAVNMETVLAAKPDIVLMKGNAQSDVSRAAEKFTQIGLPVVFVDLEHIDDYPAGIEFFGRLIGREDKAKQLANHARKVLADVDRAVASIPDDRRVRVYYAESADGLATECDESFHADAIKRAGGVIVHHCLLKTHMGMEKVSLEQIIAYNPEVIVANDPQFEATVSADPRWAGIKAVAERRVWTVPHTPFNWIDRPPSVMRILGVQWLAKRFYPKAYPIDLRSELREFHQLFMGIKLGDEDLDKWLKP
ncbi:ABC transporter substrate-binding protein [Rhodoferax sp.]|uniref:ABC transporter substrate-binding protein n=1 Tax=Rhodoferax sp. TaxID=50421 RepID=UPI00284DD684|nr:ABC transporter substrate-binding protein [Rhodoferax sp.]MDR3368545.1 ABC transporter substrate-binding protein [Rhodoferax sp.]